MRLKILFAASEVAPFAKTGGLADVAGSLPLALAALGHDVRVVLPRYGRSTRRPTTSGTSPRAMSPRIVERTVRYPRRDHGRERPRLLHQQGPLLQPPELYRTPQGDYIDNAERFIFFSRAVPELCRVLDFSPHIIHCNDWQTGLVPLYLRRFYAGVPQFHHSRTVFTIHNLGYQGIFWKRDLSLTGLGWDAFTPEILEFFDNINLLKAGVTSADAVTTVSATYSKEIQTPEFGHGLDGTLRSRAAHLHGIVNGIDYKEWDPATDPALSATTAPAGLRGNGSASAHFRRSSASRRETRRSSAW